METQGEREEHEKKQYSGSQSERAFMRVGVCLCASNSVGMCVFFTQGCNPLPKLSLKTATHNTFSITRCLFQRWRQGRFTTRRQHEIPQEETVSTLLSLLQSVSHVTF